MSGVTAPVTLLATHEVSHFDCGQEILNVWLKNRALANDKYNFSRTFVSLHSQNQVAGFYSLAASSVNREHVPKPLQRNSPSEIPVILLGRLGVDVTRQQSGLGRSLLQDALLRTLNASKSIGATAVLVHALTEPAMEFYIKRGFSPSATDDFTLTLPISRLKESLRAALD